MEERLSSLLEDRSRIGQNLHDHILQSLYAIQSNIQTRRLTSPDRVTHTSQPPQDITGQINRLIGEIRHMIQGLNEGVVKDSRLTDDLYALKSTYNEIGHVRITLDLQPAAVEVLTRDEEREILTIIREALSNSVRHAHASHATISIRRRGAKIRIHISDNGAGFDVKDNQHRGYGLASIESRARKIGGTLRLHSELGRGTQLTVEFSLEPMLTPV
jgi:signal transduction histidine kinase